MPQPVGFYSEGYKLTGDLYLPPEESASLYARAGEPKRLVTLSGFGHYEVYAEPALGQVMAETTAWFRRYIPAQP